MPNDCWNNVTFAFKQKGDKVSQVYDKYFNHIKEYFDKELNDGHAFFEKFDETPRGMIIRYFTGWLPDEETIKKVIEEYPEIYIKNEYDIEDGVCGIMIYNENKYSHYKWTDLCLQQSAYYFGDCEEEDLKEE